MSLGRKDAELRVRGGSILEVTLPDDLFSCSWPLTSAGTQRQERSPDHRRVRFAGHRLRRVLRSWWERGRHPQRRPPGQGAGNLFVTKGKDRGSAQSRAQGVLAEKTASTKAWEHLGNEDLFPCVGEMGGRAGGWGTS